MATPHWPVVAGLLVLLAANAQWADAGTCKPASCHTASGNGIFKYQPGTTYVYQVEGQTLTDLPEQQGEAVKLQLKATAEVNFGADCTNTLQLKDVKVTGPNAKVYGNLKALEAYPVRFSFNDGQVDPEICADAEDSNTALNIKRAVISLLQASTPQATGASTKTEVDVFGVCLTSFQIDVTGAETRITKSRNLNKCQYRETMRNLVSTSTYATSSEFQGSPLLDSNLVVEMKVKNGFVQSASSHEVYLYRPFSNQDAGAKTIAHTTLTFKSKSAQPAHACKANAPRSIIFDNPHGHSTEKSSTAAIVAAMQSCKESMPDSVKSAAATEFRRLVKVFRESKKDHLLTVYGQVKTGAGFADKESAKKLFLDALIRAGTGDSVQAAIELLKSKEISGMLARIWYSSFGFVRHATPESLSEAASLLDSPDAPAEAYLGVGALGSRYCSEHTCAGNPHFAVILSKLSKPLAAGCKCTSNEHENKIIAALKGIENMKGMDEATAELIRVCMSDPAAPARVRVAALETARSDACQPQIKKTALELMANTQEDSEIRIKAYLAAVECPCGKCANAVKAMLDVEPVHQVGAFVVSHLRNVRASANPDKAAQKHHLSQIRATKKFPFDVRKFSSNYELSGLLDAINVGSSAEANVIYSQRSYLPRSTSLNLTTEVFGHSLNLIEVGTRAENLERLIESYFGPKGYFKSHTFEEILTSGKSSLMHLKEKFSGRFDKSFRGKRSVPVSALEAFRKSVHQPEHDLDMDLDMSVKMFGSTVCHKSYHGSGQDFSADKMVDSLFDFVDGGISKAKNFNYDIKHHTLFYENDLAYPTGLGFPLKMSIEGSAAVHMKLDGKFDLHAILKDPKNAQFHFEVVPSGAVEVIGSMSVDAHAVTAGLKVTADLHTATGVNVNVKALEGTGIDLTFGLPVGKQEIVNFRTEVLSSVKEAGLACQETPLAFNTKRKEFHGCFDQLSSALGVTVCGDVGVPLEGVTSKAALFPLNGPSKLAFSIQSDDVHAYKFKGYFNLKDEDRKAIEFLLDTPNSKTNRKVELVLEAIRKPNVEFRAKFSSPVKNAMAEVVYVDTSKENSVAARVMADSQEYYLKLGAQVSGTAEHQVYKPSIDYRFPGESEKIVKGKGKGKPQKQKAPEYSVEGTITVDRAGDSRKYTFTDLCLTLPIGKLTLNGNTGYDAKSVHTDLQIQRDGDNISLKGKGEMMSPRNFKVKGEFKVSTYPDLGVSVDWMYNRGEDQLESKLVVIHGQDLSSQQACLTAHTLNKYHYNKETKDFGFDGMGSVTYPLMGVIAKVEAKISPKRASYGIAGSYDKYSVASKGHAYTGVKAAGDYDVAFEANVLDSSVHFESKRDVVSPHDSKFSTKLHMKPGGKYELTADTVCRTEPGNVQQKVVAVLLMEGNPEPHTLDVGLEVKPTVFAAHMKADIGSKCFVDLLTTLNKGANPSGNFKAMILDHIDGAGEFGYNAGKGSLNGYLKFLKVQQMIKAQGACSTVGTKRSGSLDVSFSESDPNKKIHYEMECDAKPDSLDTKHTLVVLGYTTVFSAKGEKAGAANDGTIKGSAALTLPTGHHMTGSLDHTLHALSGETNGAWRFEVAAGESKGAPARCVILTAKADRCSKENMYFDIDTSLVYKNLQAKELKFSVASKHLPDGEKRHVELLGKIENSLGDMSPMIHVKADIATPMVNYYGKVFLAADANIEVTGKYQHGSEEKSVPYLSDSTVVFNLPTGELKNVKIVENWHFLSGTAKGVPCELRGSMVTTYNGANTIKLDVDVKGSDENGQGKISLSLPKDEPRVFKATYLVGKGPDIEREGSMTYLHGTKEGFVEMKMKLPQDKKSFHFTVNGRTPSEKIKTFGVAVNSARGEAVVEADVTVTADDKKVVVSTKYGRDWRNPLFEIVAVHPMGKSSVGFFFRQKDGATDHYEGELKYEHNEEKGHGKFDVLIPSASDFTVTVDVDSTRFDLKSVHLVISNKPGVKGGKSLSILQTEAGETTINGKLDYTFEDNADGVLLSAGGTLKVRGENRQCKIVFKKIVITSPNDNGFEYVFTSSLGDQSLEALYQQKTKNIHFKVNGCKSKGACAHAEYLDKLVIDGLDFSYDLIAEVDSTGLGFDTDIAFKRTTFKKGTQFSHLAELNNRKKQVFLFKLGFDDKTSKVCLITPTREMAVDSVYQLVVDPKNKQHISYQYEVNAWLDKVRQPEVKATFQMEGDYLRAGDTVTVKGEAKFKHPSLAQDMCVKSSTVLSGRQGLSTVVDIDVFAKKAQKIVIDGKVSQNQIANGYNYTSTWSIKSKGQKLDMVFEDHLALSWSALGAGSALIYTDDKGKRDLGFGFEFTSNKAVLFAKSPRDALIDVNIQHAMLNKMPSTEAFISFLGCQGLIAKAHFEPDNRFVYSIFKKSTPQNKLTGEICFDVLTKVHNRLDWVVGSETKGLVNVGFAMDDKMTPDFNVNFDNFKALIEVLRGDVTHMVEKAKHVSKGIEEEVKAEMTDIAEGLKKAQPNLKLLLEAYQSQIKTLRNEITSDASVKELSDVIKKFVGATTEIFGQITETLASIADKALDLFDQLSATIIGSLKRFMPLATESCNKIFSASVDLFSAVATQVLNQLAQLVDLLKKHEPELKKIGEAITSMGREVFQSVFKGFKHLVKEVEDLCRVVYDQIRALPVFAMLQEKGEDFKSQFSAYIPKEQIFGAIHEATKAVKDTLPTQELRDFVDCISVYFEKLLKKEKLDYAAEGKKIYQKGVAALRSVFTMLRAEMDGKDPAAAGIVGVVWPFSLKALYKVPVAAAVHFSVIDFLRSDDLPSLRDYLVTYLPRSLNPFDLVAPFKSYGVIIDTSHFFTFDRRHFTFKGASCSYILVQDVSDGNFTLVLNLEKNGKFKSLELSDGKDTMEYTSQKSLSVNGKPSEFPAKTEGMNAWRKYHTVSMKTSGGLSVKMNMDYHVTVVGLSGFYHGRVRGLLGDSNYEPFDDYRLPSGQICTDAAELANAYQVGGSCAPGTSLPEHKHKQEAMCTSIFSSQSSLRYAFPFYCPDSYREACDHLVSETSSKKQEYACRTAAAYVMGARKYGMLLDLPAVCAQCDGPSKKMSLGETVSVKLPSQMADVVVLVEQVTANAEIYKDLVTPLVKTLTDDLKGKGITQVNFALIGYGHPDYEDPVHHTSNGKLGFDGKAKLQFGDAEKVQKEWGKTTEEKIDYIQRLIEVETGVTPIADTFYELLHYPWRAGASRAVVLVTGTPCDEGVMFGKLRQFLISKMSSYLGVSVHVVSPMEGFTIAGSKDPKAQKSIVGFDEDTVYSIADGKKKTLEGTGNTDLRSEIEYSPDACITLAQKSHGAAYNARNFLETKGNQRKQFIQVIVNKLSSELTAEMSEQCECRLHNGVYTETWCKVTGRKESEQLTSQTESTKSKKGKKPKN